MISGCNCCQSDCHQIIQSQRRYKVHWQIPEPWNGSIESADILFILSNPSYSQNEVYPDYPDNVPLCKKPLSKQGWGISKIEDFFENRFESTYVNNEKYVKGLRVLMEENGKYSRGNIVRTWKMLCRYAYAIKYGDNCKYTSILDQDLKESGLSAMVDDNNVFSIEDDNNFIRPGIDFAITEVVKCKAKKENGVNKARKECANRYFQKVLSLFGGEILCVVGKHAQDVFNKEYGKIFNRVQDDSYKVSCRGTCVINGKEFKVIFLPHPSSRKTGVTINNIRVL